MVVELELLEWVVVATAGLPEFEDECSSKNAPPATTRRITTKTATSRPFIFRSVRWISGCDKSWVGVAKLQKSTSLLPDLAGVQDV